MSPSPTSRSDDLLRLAQEGFAIEVRAGHLLVHDVPHVNASGDVLRGVLVTTLALLPDGRTTTPDTHVAFFIGSHPCDTEGRPLTAVVNSSADQHLAEGITVNHMLSSKLVGTSGYRDYFEKVKTYVDLISPHATRAEPTATALTFRTITNDDPDSPFAYPDTSSTRARIAAVTAKLKQQRVAIIGLGGTGAYILDLATKTPVAEIHLFDGDRFHLHNAFRSPGAATAAVLATAPYKVTHYAETYSAMHTGIVGHPVYVTVDNLNELEGFDFVFVAVDDGDARKVIVATVEQAGVAFVDVGMGLHCVDDTIGGQVRTTTSTPGRRDHLHRRVPLAGADVDNAYNANIQIADLNALNAALAVVRWKKWSGFYADFDHEHHAVYVVDGNTIINDEADQ